MGSLWEAHGEEANGRLMGILWEAREEEADGKLKGSLCQARGRSWTDTTKTSVAVASWFSRFGSMAFEMVVLLSHKLSFCANTQCAVAAPCLLLKETLPRPLILPLLEVASCSSLLDVSCRKHHDALEQALPRSTQRLHCICKQPHAAAPPHCNPLPSCQAPSKPRISGAPSCWLQVAAAGMVINTLGWVEGLGYELLLHVVKSFKVSAGISISKLRWW